MTATYKNAVRTFDHGQLAAIPAYHKLREALNELCLSEDAEGTTLEGLLDAVRDMALTAPFADSCPHCRGDAGDAENGTYLQAAWPHAVKRKNDWLTCSYLCPRCSAAWTCGYSVRSVEIP